MVEGGARGGECAVAAWHRPRGGQRVTPRRHTVLAEPSLGPAVTGPLRCARPAVRRRGRRGTPRRDVVRVGSPDPDAFQSGHVQNEFSPNFETKPH
jgi:hypothetical protein